MDLEHETNVHLIIPRLCFPFDFNNYPRCRKALNSPLLFHRRNTVSVPYGLSSFAFSQMNSNFN